MRVSLKYILGRLFIFLCLRKNILKKFLKKEGIINLLENIINIVNLMLKLSVEKSILERIKTL